MGEPRAPTAAARAVRRSRDMTTITGKALWITVAVNPIEVAAVPTPHGKPTVGVKIAVCAGGGPPDRYIHMRLTAKSIRKARALIEKSPPGGVVTVVRGQFVAGDVVAGAGLMVMPKGPRQAVPGEAAAVSLAPEAELPR
jgi:hypothetical protein